MIAAPYHTAWKLCAKLRLTFARAVRQVPRQRDAQLAQNGVLWLPEAKNRNAGYYRDIVVVQGDDHFLIDRLRRLKYRFTVQFPRAPSLALREQLRPLHFRWNPGGRCWEGRCSEAGIEAVRPAIKAAGGTLCMP